MEEDVENGIRMEDRLRRHSAYVSIFTENPNGIEVYEHLKQQYFFENDSMYQPGCSHADIAFYLGQRSVIAYINKVINTTKDQITGENQQGKADEE